MEILGDDGGNSPKLALDVEWDAAIAIYAKRRWPVGTRKAVAREWDLSEDEARSVVDHNASKRTLKKIWRHSRGGWEVALPVMGAVIGEPVHAFFRRQIVQAAKEAERAQEHERLAEAAYRRLEGDLAGAGEDGRRGRGAGALGVAQAGRLAGGDR